MRNTRESLKSRQSIYFPSTSDYVLPLSTLKERFINIWNGLTWPVMKKILKANLAVSIALCVMFYHPFLEKASVATALAPVAVEFILPSKSLGFIAEDALFGAFMCTISAGYSILGTYCASLVRDTSNPSLAQPPLCAILSSFLIVGAFVLNYARVKIQQANVGGMLSALIMVLSLTGAVLDREWTPSHVLVFLVSALAGFAIMILVSFFLSPDNSTTGHIQELIKVLELFDGMATEQVNGFFDSQQLNLADKAIDSPALIHKKSDALLVSLTDNIRVTGLGLSYNTISPMDIHELTNIMKQLRIPLQGIAIAHTTETNMWKMELLEQNRNDILQKSSPPIFTFSDQQQSLNSPSQNEHDERDIVDSDSLTNERKSRNNDDSCNLDHESAIGSDISKDSGNIYGNSSILLSPHIIIEESSSSIFSYANSGIDLQQTIQHDSGLVPASSQPCLSVALDSATFNHNMQRQEYNSLLRKIRQTHLDIMSACSLAIVQVIKRLRRMQSIDPRYHDKPLLYKYIFGKGGPNTAVIYDPLLDPSVDILLAIQRFDEQRLQGLETLFKYDNLPPRSLLLILNLQFNIRTWAEQLYALTSLTFEMDQVRQRRRLWVSRWPGSKRIDLETGLHTTDTDTNEAAIIKPLNVVSNNHPLQPHEKQMESTQSATPTRGQVFDPNNSNSTWAYHHYHQHQGNTDYRYFANSRIRHKLSKWKHLINQNKKSITPSILADPSSYHDPDASYPTTKLQRLFYILWTFGEKHVYTSDTAFALRASIVVTALTLPGFLEQSLTWYHASRSQWATVVALIWMGPSVGSSFFGSMVRTMGTFVGAAAGLVVWEICRGKVWALLILTYIVNLPFYILYSVSVYWRAAGLFSLITISLIVGYGYIYMVTGVQTTVYNITSYRIASVLAGVSAAMIISILPYAHTSRIQVRHRISDILGDMGALFSSILGVHLKGSCHEHHIKDINQKMLRTFANTVRCKIQATRALLDESSYEPNLRGIFPEKKYLKILQVLDTMLNLMLQMELSLQKMDTQWRLNVANMFWTERKRMISSFLTALQLASNALVNKTPLPPYILRPTTARRTLTDMIRRCTAFKAEKLNDPNYTYYSAYMMNSEQLAVEIEVLVATVTDLVGSDNVSIILDSILG